MCVFRGDSEEESHTKWDVKRTGVYRDFWKCFKHVAQEGERKKILGRFIGKRIRFITKSDSSTEGKGASRFNRREIALRRNSPTCFSTRPPCKACTGSHKRVMLSSLSEHPQNIQSRRATQGFVVCRFSSKQGVIRAPLFPTRDLHADFLSPSDYRRCHDHRRSHQFLCVFVHVFSLCSPNVLAKICVSFRAPMFVIVHCLFGANFLRISNVFGAKDQRPLKLRKKPSTFLISQLPRVCASCSPLVSHHSAVLFPAVLSP